jgi:hypothetical protein
MRRRKGGVVSRSTLSPAEGWRAMIGSVFDG